MEYTTEQIQEMAKIEANNKKHEHIKLDYQDGIYYGFQQGFEKALSLFAVSGRSEQLVCGRHIKTCVFYKDGKCNSNDYCRDQVEQTN